MKNTTKTGSRAESAVVAWLKRHKHQIVIQNWRTKACEIDIISLARNDSGEVEIYFTEVKMRKNSDFGGGLAAISKTKLQKMQRAAELFIARHPKIANHQPLLAAADVDGSFTVQDFVVLA